MEPTSAVGLPTPRPRVSYHQAQALLALTEDDTKRKGTQQGSVRIKAGSWYVSYREWRTDKDGNLKYAPTERRIGRATGKGKISKSEALARATSAHVARANDLNQQPQGLLTLAQFVETRFQPEHIDMLGKAGRSHYRTMLNNHILPTLGDLQLRSIDPSIVQVLIAAKHAAEYSSQTVLHIRNCLSAILRHARTLRYIEGALATEGVKLPTLRHKPKQALTWVQVGMLASKVPLRHRALILLLAQSGMRIGEAAGLCWRHINLTGEFKLVDGEAIPPHSVLVIDNYTHGERHGLKANAKDQRVRKCRKVPLTSETFVELSLHFERTPYKGAHQPVFAGRTGNPLDAHNVGQRSLKTAGKAIGCPWVSWHTLRHTAATLGDLVGLSTAERQKLLGHTTAALAVRYTHPEMDAARAKMELMSASRTHENGNDEKAA